MPQKGGGARMHYGDYKITHIGKIHGRNAMGCGAEIMNFLGLPFKLLKNLRNKADSGGRGGGGGCGLTDDELFKIMNLFSKILKHEKEWKKIFKTKDKPKEGEHWIKRYGISETAYFGIPGFTSWQEIQNKPLDYICQTILNFFNDMMVNGESIPIVFWNKHNDSGHYAILHKNDEVGYIIDPQNSYIKSYDPIIKLGNNELVTFTAAGTQEKSFIKNLKDYMSGHFTDVAIFVGDIQLTPRYFIDYADILYKPSINDGKTMDQGVGGDQEMDGKTRIQLPPSTTYDQMYDIEMEDVDHVGAAGGAAGGTAGGFGAAMGMGGGKSKKSRKQKKSKKSKKSRKSKKSKKSKKSRK